MNTLHNAYIQQIRRSKRRRIEQRAQAILETWLARAIVAEIVYLLFIMVKP